MKILFLIRSLCVGGAEGQLVALAKALQREGVNVSVAVFYLGGELESELRQHNIPIYSLEKKGRWDIVFFLSHFISLIKQYQPDVLHSYLVTPNLIAGLMKLRFPKLKLVWGVRASSRDFSKYPKSKQFSFKLACYVSRLTDLIIANSYAGKEHHVKLGYPEHKINVICNGIDTDKFKTDFTLRQTLRKQWKINDKICLVGIVARLDPVKDHPTFLNSAARALKENKNLRFVCVGDGNTTYKKQLQQLSTQLGLDDYLIWAGARSDMTAVYNALDILVSSSSGEGFSNAIAEAMACEIPCVVTNVGDSAQLIGESGRVVNPEDTEAMAVAINDLARLSVAELSFIKQQARNKIIENYSVLSLAQTTKDVLAQL